MNEDLPIGINPIILNNKGEILLGRRINEYKGGTYSLPGDKLKIGETFEECIKREVKEETNLDINIKDIEIINIANTIGEKHFIQIGALVRKYKGTPQIMEPNKCDDLRFFSLNNLPNVFDRNLSNILLYQNNEFYNIKNNIGKEN